jgi:chorismate--pyruvate lyase
MTAQNQQPSQEQLIAEAWETEPDFAGRQPSDLIRSWLNEPGLLTARMRAQCDNDFRLEVLRDNTPGTNQSGTNESGSDQSELHRQVILWCDKQPCIFAETSIPANTATTHPWLRELGDEPLGERLQSQPDVSRSLFVYALVDISQLPAQLADCGETELWARRSDFYIGEDLLTVTEIFLPGITDCGNSNNG